MKKIIIMASSILILIIVLIEIVNIKSEVSKTKELCIENRYNILNKDIDAQLQLIGQKISIKENSKNYKIVFAKLNEGNNSYDFNKDILSSLEYYAEKRDDSLSLKSTKLVYLNRNEDLSFQNDIHNEFKDSVIIINDSSNYFTAQLALPKRGVIILLLNKDNICLYAFCLEQNNDRKILENSPVMFNLIKNL
ncbi:MAG: hypothetical protein M1480_11050 [Bacteroidetes bacterium]|nr:hypothetical protein [Bacteroidota bacterium]